MDRFHGIKSASKPSIVLIANVYDDLGGFLSPRPKFPLENAGCLIAGEKLI